MVGHFWSLKNSFKEVKSEINFNLMKLFNTARERWGRWSCYKMNIKKQSCKRNKNRNNHRIIEVLRQRFLYRSGHLVWLFHCTNEEPEWKRGGTCSRSFASNRGWPNWSWALTFSIFSTTPLRWDRYKNDAWRRGRK